MNPSPKLTIVIPCYNQGHFLPETLNNLSIDNKDYEIIIINDGSTEEESLKQFEYFSNKGYFIFNQQNMGLAAARNKGISLAKAPLIMLLDADNCIETDFLITAIKIFDDQDIDVVYSDAEFFGIKQGRWVVGEFNLQKLMINNYIDACAMVRKSIFIKLGGYDVEMKKIKTGWEDWDMWLKIAFAGKKFYYLPIVGFKYRVADASMISGIKKNKGIQNRLYEYMQNKYPSQLGFNHINNFVKGRFKPQPVLFVLKLTLFTWFNKFFNKLVTNNKIINSI